jgi:hypothetical protein
MAADYLINNYFGFVLLFFKDNSKDELKESRPFVTWGSPRNIFSGFLHFLLVNGII